MRMRLHMTTRYGDNEVYPIYEITNFADFISLSGYTSLYTNNSVSSKAYKTRHFQIVNNNIGNYIPLSIPKKEDEEGNIIPFFHRYNTLINNRYYIEQSVRESFAAIEQGIKPPDWGTNPNYVQLVNITQGMNNRPGGGYGDVNVNMPICVSKYESFDSSASYYEDTKRACMRMFYTQTGTSFTVSKLAFYSGGYYFPRQYVSGRNNIANISGAQYAYTGDDDNILVSSTQSVPYINCYIQGSSNPQNQFPAWNSGANCPMFFIHYNDNGTDFYGVATCQMSDFTENAYPVAIDIIVYDSTFWGESIIPGAGGSGTWGNNTTIGGANGTWTFPSNSRGDGTAAPAEAIATERRTALQAFFTASHGYQLHQILPNEVQNIFGVLYGDTFISRYTTSIYNPLSAVISLHMLPQRLCDPLQTTSPLTLSGYDVSAALPTPQNFPEISTIHSEHIGTIDIDATDTFLDYAPYTRAYLHLPYIGVLEIDINAIAAGSLGVDYITDAMTGNCAAYVWCSDRDGVCTFKYCATGNCAYSLPMFAAQQDGAAIGKIVNSSLGVAMAAITGNAHAAIASVGGIAGGIFDAATTQRNTQIAGSFGGNPGLITDTVCWLEIVRPVWCNPENYKMLDGVPSMLSGTIKSFNDYGDGYEGFLKIIDLDTDGIQATDDELTEIETILKSGIFVNEE